MTDFNMPRGASFSNADPGLTSRLREEENAPEPFSDYETLRRYSEMLSSTSALNTDAASMMGELMAQSAWEPGATTQSLVSDFSGTNATINLETQKALLDQYYEQSSGWEERLEIWNRLAADVRQALVADGYTVPTDPTPGGIDIPFTSPFKKLANKVIPRFDPFSDGNAQLPTGEGVITNVGNALGSAASSAVESPAKNLFRGFDVADEFMRGRPLRFGQAAREDVIGETPMFNRLTNTVSPGAGTMLSGAVFGLASLFTGRAGDLWDLSEERNATIRPTAVSRALEMLDGDDALHVMASTLLKNDYNIIEATADITGLEPGDPGFEDIYIKYSLLMSPPQDAESIDPKQEQFANALKEMSNNRMSFGHDMAETYGFEQGTAGHNIGTAAFEMGSAILLDPTMVLGKVNRIRRIARFGTINNDLVGGLSRGRQLAMLARETDEIKAGVRAADQLTDAVRTERIIEANAHNMFKIRESKWGKLIINEDQQIEYGRSLDRVMERVARVGEDAGAEYTWLDLMNDVPALRYMRSQLIQAKADGALRTTDDVWAWFQGKAGTSALNSGAIGRDPRLIKLPQLTRAGARQAKAKAWWTQQMDLSNRWTPEVKEGIEAAARNGRHGEIEIGEASRAIKVFRDSRSRVNIVTNNLFGLRPTLRRFTRQVPRENNIHTTVGTSASGHKLANEAIDEFERFVDVGQSLAHMPDEVAAEYKLNFMMGNSGERVVISRTLTTEILFRSGILDDSKKARELIEKYGLSLDHHFVTTEVVDDILTSKMGALGNHTAIWDTQLAEKVAIPRFVDIRAAIAKHQTWAAFSDQTYGRMETVLNKVWKPMVLMRLGFITRAAGEETASFVLRLGMFSYARAQFGRRWIQSMHRNPVTRELVTTREMSPFFRHVTNAGQRLKYWSHTRPMDIADLSRMTSAQVTQNKALTVAKLLKVAKKNKNAAEEGRLAIQLDEISSVMKSDYWETVPATSRRMSDLGDAIISWAHKSSPRFYDLVHKPVKIGDKSIRIPSRQDIAKTLMGERYVGTIDGIPQFESGGRLFSLKPGGLRSRDIFELSDQVGMDNLIWAEYMANANPAVARIRMNALQTTYAHYGEVDNELNRIVERSYLASERRFVAVPGKNSTTPNIKMVRRTNEWKWVDVGLEDARQGIGNALELMANDATVVGSGSLKILNSYVSDDLARQIDELLGEDGVAQLEQVRLFLARHAGRERGENEVVPMITRAWGYSDNSRNGLWMQTTELEKQESILFGELRYALAQGEDLPYHIDFPIFDQINALPGNNNKLRSLLYPDSTGLRIPLSRNLDETLADVEQNMWAFMQRPEYQPELQAMAQTVLRDGTRITRPLPAGQLRLYGLSLRPREVEALRQVADSPQAMDQLANRLRLSLQRRGLKPDQVEQIVGDMTRSTLVNTSWMDEIADGVSRTTMPGLKSDEFVPASPYLFADPELADDAAKALNEALELTDVPAATGMVATPRVPNEPLVAVGFMDIPQESSRRLGLFLPMNADPKTGNRAWGSASVFQVQDPGIVHSFNRLDPSQRVVFAETADGRWLDAAEIRLLPEDVRPELTGRVQWASGQTEHATRRTLATRRLEGVEELLVTERGEVLNELTAHLANGTFNQNYHMIGIAAEDLPKGIHVPVEVEVSSLSWANIVSGWFQGVVDPAMEGIIRTPHWNHNMASALPIAENWYQWAVKGDLNDEMTVLFDDLLGLSDQQSQNFLDHIHHLFNDPDLVDDESTWSLLMQALASGTRTSPEEGAALFRRVILGTEDKMHRSYEAVLDELVQNHVARTGKMPMPIDVAHYESMAEGTLPANIVAKEVLESRVKDLDDETAFLLEEFERLQQISDDFEELKALGITFDEWVATGSDELFMSMEFVSNPRLKKYFVEDVDGTRLGARNYDQELQSILTKLDEADILRADAKARIANYDLDKPLIDESTSYRGTTLTTMEDLEAAAEAKRGTVDTFAIERNWTKLQKWSEMRYWRFQEASQQASIRATDMTVQFIDDHRFRSQFQQTIGNLMPFWFAEEQFIKRQIRMLVDSPESIRRASILMNAARQSHLIDRDGDGNEILVYPGTKMINEGLLAFAGRITGVEGLEADAQPMSTDVRYVLPGYSGEYVEGGGGPFLGFSTAAVAGWFPELEPLDRILNRSEISQGKKPYQHFLPGSVQRIVDQFGIKFLDSGRLLNAQLHAVSISDVNGTTPDPTTATPVEMEEWLNDIKHHARILNVMDFVLYEASGLPSGASVQYDKVEMSEDFREIVFQSQIPIQEAYSLYFEKYPHATAFTVFGSESASGAGISVTHEAFAWMDDNDELLRNYPLAAAWLMPAREGDDRDNFNRRANEEAFERGLRERRSPEEFLTEIYFAEGARLYYPMMDEFDRAIWELTELGKTEEAQVLERIKKAEKDKFLNTHPVFENQMSSNTDRRKDTIAQRDMLLAIPRDELPPGPHVDATLALMAGHKQFNDLMSSLTDDDSVQAREIRESARLDFIMWAAEYVRSNPDTERYFTANIRSDTMVIQGGPDVFFEVERILGREF